MVSWQVAVAIAAASALTAGIACVGVVWLSKLVRVASREGSTPSRPGSESPVPSDVDGTVLRVLSERLAILEGSIPALQQTLTGYSALASRIADLEARLPTLADAYDRFSQTTLNAEKRRSETERRAELKRSKEEPEGPTVAEAAAQMGLAADAAAVETAVQKSADGKRPGVYGSGGNSGRG